MVDVARSSDESLALKGMRERGPWFFAIFDNAPFALALTRVPDGITVDVNEAFQKLFEFTREEVLGKTSTDLGIADPESRARLAAELRERGRVRDFECIRSTKAGARVVLQLNVDPIEVEGSAYVLTSARDVTRARSAEAELRALVDNLPELAWTARPDGFIDFYNRRWYEYTGTTFEDMQGWGWQSLHDPNELPRVMESWSRSIATQQPFDQTFPLRRKDGVFRWFLTRVAPMFDAAGKLTRWVGVNTDIDDQRRDQEAAHEAEQRFRLVFESSPVGMIKMNADGRIVLVNAQIEALFGYAREELVGQPIEKLVPARFGGLHPEHRKGFFADPQSRAMGGGRELYGLRKDGSEVAVEIGLNPIRTTDGVAVLGSVVDVSERRRAEHERMTLVERLRALNADLEERVRSRTSELSKTLQERERAILALRASEADFRLLAESMPQIVWITEPDGKNIYFNERWMSYTGLTLEESVGDGWNKPFHPDDRQRAWDAWQAATTTIGVYSLECRLRRADGAYLWWLIRGVPILDADGRVRKWFGTCTDIDAMKRSAESAQQQMAALVESADDAIITEGLDGTILSWNPGASRLLGYGADESVGHPITMLIPEDRLDEEARILEQVTTGKHVRHFETVRRRKDGSLVDVSISVSPVRDRSGAIVAASKIMRDTTERNEATHERVRLVEELKTLNAALEERVRSRTSELSQTLRERETLLREKTSLLQEVHHRVKNNLQMISSLLNLQARQIHDKEARASFLDSQGRVRSIALLHESLYQSDDLGRVDMQEYVDKLVGTLKRTYGQTASSAHFVTRIDRVHLPVDVAVPCGLIVNELVTNALKHAFIDAREGVQNEVRVEMRRVDDDLMLLVADNGAGFADTVDPGRQETMGLTLVRDLSAQLGGHAQFATAGGARCTVRFPVPGQKNGGRS
jgi:PAS domain S-box-containing protein